MSLESKIVALATAIGNDVKDLRVKQGDLTSLSTTAKTNLVAAINELATMIAGAGVSINDTAGNGDTAVTWSADKIFDTIEDAKTAVKNDLTNGASTALDTLSELAAALGDDPNFATTIATELSSRVRVDAVQTFTSPQQAQGRDNIGAAAAADLTALTTGLADYDRDFTADYNTAKA
jgi:hypothetical protein